MILILRFFVGWAPDLTLPRAVHSCALPWLIMGGLHGSEFVVLMEDTLSLIHVIFSWFNFFHG